MVDVKITFKPLEPAGLVNQPEGLRGEPEIVVGGRVIGKQERGRIKQESAGFQDSEKGVGYLVRVVHVLENRYQNHHIESRRIFGGEILDEGVSAVWVENEIVRVNERPWATNFQIPVVLFFMGDKDRALKSIGVKCDLSGFLGRDLIVSDGGSFQATGIQQRSRKVVLFVALLDDINVALEHRVS